VSQAKGQWTPRTTPKPVGSRRRMRYGRGEGPMSDVIELPSGRGRTAELIFPLSSFRRMISTKVFEV
jgi:hypothetical protein